MLKVRSAARPSVFALLLPVLLSWDAAVGQDSTHTLKRADEVMEDVLDLTDPVLSVWPDVNTVEIEVFSAGIDKLLEAYEADRLDADERTRAIEAMISEAKRDEELIKTQIKAAKDADDDVEKDRLEDLKDLYVLRRKYLVRISKLRAEERKLSESRLDYVSKLADVLSISQDFLGARESGDRDDLLGTERELIRQSKELGVRLGGVSSNLKKVNTERDKAFEAREKLISAAH